MAGKQQTDSQRIRYFDGQLLTARDLRDDVAYEARMRGLHVRALHNTWGVALGLAVTVQNNNVVKVSPGIAYDCRGRELFSARDLLIGPPPRPLGSQVNAWLFDLVIRYDESGERGRADSVLCTDGVNPGEERPLWRWRFAGDAVGFTPTSTTAPPEPLRLGEEIPLARFVIQPTEPRIGPPDFTERRNAQGLVRPHIADGQVQQPLLPHPDGNELSFTMTINTSAGGFNQTPFYFARITVPILLDLAQQGGQTAELLRRLLGPFVTIRTASRQSFILDIRFALSQPRGGVVLRRENFALLALLRRVAGREDVLSALVNWVGVEPTGGCPPPPLAFPYFLFLPTFINAAAGVGTLGT
ncbi:MAG: hypothetical protein KA314_02930 [Chloroflexi bacterium]|nr:hypothetical protein [Chloroflexota bacterium]MBP8054764.1 hypothetical protein [Chloroflexota bacterium]